jgi:phytoene desaturase
VIRRTRPTGTPAALRARRIVVVGGGMGGLAAAIRLGAAGHHVTVLERNDELGGKLTVRHRDGFTFETGPSLLTLPGVFDDLFRAAGTRLADEVGLVRLDPQFRYHWPDGTAVTVADDPASNAALPGWSSFVAAGERIWEVAERTFFAGPIEHPLSLARRMRSPLDLVRIDPLRTLDRLARRHLPDPRLQQWAGRYATYSGSSPYAAPATLACIPYVESAFGSWYVRGGLGALRDAVVRVAARVGVALHTGTAVARIDVRGGRVAGVSLADGSSVPADVVVSNTDATVLYERLLPAPRALARVRRATPSTSGLVVLVGARGTTPGLAHHTVWFSSDYPREFRQIVDEGRVADEPTVYACVSSVTDPSQAPADHENWFLLVNTPARPEKVPAAYAEVVLDRLRDVGVDLRSRALFTEVITPADIEERYATPGGAIYGTSSNGRRAAFVRPANRGAVPGLYLVGGSSHPGGGLPLVTISARIVADMIAHDLAAATSGARP